MGVTDQHKIRGRKPGLVGENSSRREDDVPDQECYQINARTPQCLKIPYLNTELSPEVAARCTRQCAPGHEVHARWCTCTFIDCGELPTTCYRERD
ncbi:hypothetical protein TNCV_1297621 [Trichonephila clavipes]|nr:hypothetical protein TNCV_1297621 [Trichonephila clavipes]